MSNSLLQTAEAYLDRGLSVIPMIDKKPAVRWKRYQATRPTRRHLNRWFDGNHKPTGLAIIFGAVSGNLAQRDFDSTESYRRWSDEQPELAATLPTAGTRRGMHVYFGADPCELADLRRRIGKTGNGAIKLGDGELRADVGCYSVAPSSKHPSGFIYHWLRPLPESVPVAPLTAFCNPEVDVSAECYTSHVLDCAGLRACGEWEDLDQRVQAAIDASLPKGPAERNDLIFLFARHLKSIPALAGAELEALEPFVRRWYAQALPRITSKTFTETLIDFHRAWKRVRFPAGIAAISPIFQRAVAAELPESARRYADEPKLQLLVALCRELQRSAGKSSFFLSCAKAGELIGAQPMVIWRWLELLKDHRVLELTKKGTTGRNGKASEYRYLGD